MKKDLTKEQFCEQIKTIKKQYNEQYAMFQQDVAIVVETDVDCCIKELERLTTIEETETSYTWPRPSFNLTLSQEPDWLTFESKYQFHKQTLQTLYGWLVAKKLFNKLNQKTLVDIGLTMTVFYVYPHKINVLFATGELFDIEKVSNMQVNCSSDVALRCAKIVYKRMRESKQERVQFEKQNEEIITQYTDRAIKFFEKKKNTLFNINNINENALINFGFLLNKLTGTQRTIALMKTIDNIIKTYPWLETYILPEASVVFKINHAILQKN